MPLLGRPYVRGADVFAWNLDSWSEHDVAKGEHHLARRADVLEMVDGVAPGVETEVREEGRRLAVLS